MARGETVTFTRDQEKRLIDALKLIVDAEAEDVTSEQRKTSSWRHPMVVPTVAFLAVLAVFLPFRLINNGNIDEPSATSVPVTQPTETTITTVAERDDLQIGEPQPVGGATVGSSLVVYDDVFYTAIIGPEDQVARSEDQGRTWEPVLTANPGDAEGLFAVGDVVMQVVEDDLPARDTVEPGSAISEAPRVLVYDPQTGDSTETPLPRPDDPEMTGLPLDGGSGCVLAGYQSWVRAEGAAVGDRLLVVGTQLLVGQLSSGEVICDNQIYRSLAWVSDDHGITWELHDVPALESVAWTGDRFAGWSSPDENGVQDILISDDGVNWDVVASSPPAPNGSFAAEYPQFTVAGDRVIGLTQFHEWTAEIPDEVTDPEDLRDALGIGPDADVSPADTLEMLGIDLPLDDNERQIIKRFNGSAAPASAVVAVSDDKGSIWTIHSVDEPIWRVAISGDHYLALSTGFSDNSVPALLASTSGLDWAQSTELPISGFIQAFAATPDAIFLGEAGSGALWVAPIQGS